MLLTSLNFSTTFAQCFSALGIFLTLDDIRNLFRDYDYQLKTYRHHNCWRSRSIELIKKMVTHMELEKTGEDIEIDQAPPIQFFWFIIKMVGLRRLLWISLCHYNHRIALFCVLGTMGVHI